MMEIGLEQNIKTKGITTKHDIASSKQKFQSDDSEGSDLSYQSSLTDQEDNNIGRIQFFKEEMARFFINYPELINKNIIQDDNQNNEQDDGKGSNKVRLNKHWESITEQILNEAKESSTSLESLAKRISLYRFKIDQSDIIDLLLQEKNIILKEIEAEILQKKNEANILGQNQKHQKNLQKTFREDNSYYSWRKRKQFQFKQTNNRNAAQRSQSQQNNNQAAIIRSNSQPSNQSILKRTDSQNQNRKTFETNVTNNTKIVQKFHRSLHKANQSKSQQNKNTKENKKKRQSNQIYEKKKVQKYQNIIQPDKQQNKHLDESAVTQQGYGSRVSCNWRHLVNFQPKTQIGKQLSEQIKKNNTASDQLGIKKTIVNFLIRYKQMINNEIINKITLSQKIQKLYSDDAKQLLMFYPSKINNFDNGLANSSSSFKDNTQDKFIKLLKQINSGPLMKYWRQLQENRL